MKKLNVIITTITLLFGVSVFAADAPNPKNDVKAKPLTAVPKAANTKREVDAHKEVVVHEEAPKRLTGESVEHYNERRRVYDEKVKAEHGREHEEVVVREEAPQRLNGESVERYNERRRAYDEKVKAERERQTALREREQEEAAARSRAEEKPTAVRTNNRFTPATESHDSITKPSMATNNRFAQSTQNPSEHPVTGAKPLPTVPPSNATIAKNNTVTVKANSPAKKLPPQKTTNK